MADKNVIIKQKLENEIVDFYPKTKSNIVVNESKNVTGSTVTDVFNNALSLEGSEHINIVPSENGGIKIDFTGSLAPNVTVQGTSEYYNPVEVTGGLNPEKTAATYTVSHKTTGPLARYTSKNETTTIGEGESKTIKIPQLEVDQFGHVRTAADEDVTITIPSTDGLVAGTGLTKDKIILGNADTNNSSKIQASSYGISNDSTNSTNKDKTIWTQQAVETLINNKITEGAQYLGIVNGHDYNTGRLTYTQDSNIDYITPNSVGDWVRVVREFSLPYNPRNPAHQGDILIYSGTSVGGLYLWDIIHTEVDTDTWRPIKVKGTDIGNSTTLNLTAGDNVSLSNNNGTVTISATDTTYKLGQNPGASNTVTLTPSSGSVQVVTIDNVANATTATQVANWLTIQLNGGTTENTNQFTYNGSVAKTINITASKVGAALSEHSHGQINNNGEITDQGVTIQDGDRILFTDKNDNDKIKRSFITFDGTTDNKALTKAGTWQTFLKVNQNITINSGTNKDGSAITGTSHGTKPTLGESGITAGTYSAIQVNTKGIAIAGSQVIKYYASSTTNATIQSDTTLAEGGFAFVEIA